MTKKEIQDSIRYIAGKYNIPVELVFAIAEQESSWNVYASRFEDRYMQKYVDASPKTFGASKDTERVGRGTSWGLCQVMGQLARELGYNRPFFGEMSNPAYGVDLACKFLRKLADKHEENWDEVVSAYNAGTPKRLSTGAFVNQPYVDSVKARWEKYKEAK